MRKKQTHRKQKKSFLINISISNYHSSSLKEMAIKREVITSQPKCLFLETEQIVLLRQYLSHRLFSLKKEKTVHKHVIMLC